MGKKKKLKLNEKQRTLFTELLQSVVNATPSWEAFIETPLGEMAFIQGVIVEELDKIQQKKEDSNFVTELQELFDEILYFMYKAMTTKNYDFGKKIDYADKKCAEILTRYNRTNFIQATPND